LERKLLHRVRAETDPAYGCRPIARPIEEYVRKGVVNIDKPAGPTSHEVVAWVKKILHLKKASHSGTLDPKVSGVQPILLGEGTKLSIALTKADKEYVCLMETHQLVPTKRLLEVFSEFTGDIYQIPPLKSAVQRRLRIRRIHYINLIEHEERYVLFRVGCEAGTYIRKLCYDIGEALGFGAHMRELRRIRSGTFTENSLVTLQTLQDAYMSYEEGDEKPLRRIVRPMEEALSHLPSVYVLDSAVDALCHGAPLAAPGVVSLDASIKKGDLVGVFTLKGEVVMLGTAEMDAERMYEAESGVVVKPKRVVMKPGTYPRLWHR